MTKLFPAGYFRYVLQLGKIKISLPVALTGFLGYYRAGGQFSSTFLYTILGILLMSMGSSALNQIQERKTDMLMQRTSARPLPSGKLSLREAWIWALLFSIVGFVLLIMTGSKAAALIGVFTLAWYNLVYTPLKKITPFAVLPGAIIGALPPLIGWTAAGGAIWEKEILLISFFLFIGQMPHYWLLLMKVGDEFRDAGLPVITDKFSKLQLRNVSFTWMVAAALSVSIFPASGIIQSRIISLIMLAGVIFFLVLVYRLTFKGEIMTHWRKTFIAENLFYLFIIVMLIADQFSELYL